MAKSILPLRQALCVYLMYSDVCSIVSLYVQPLTVVSNKDKGGSRIFPSLNFYPCHYAPKCTDSKMIINGWHGPIQT